MNRLRSVSLKNRIAVSYDDWQNNRRLGQIGKEVARHCRNHIGQPAELVKGAASDPRPVVFFRASTGLLRLSQNTAFGLLASWGLQMAGVPVVHFVCQSGMSRCVQGTNKYDHLAQPPCAACIQHARHLYAHAQTDTFSYIPNAALAASLKDLSIAELASYTLPASHSKSLGEVPLGSLVVPSLRWILRRHHLLDDEPTRYLLREYLLSAANVAEKFAALLESVSPQALVIFNGMFYPEAVAKWLARKRGLRVISHEVAMRPFTAFFTDGEATAYPIHIPDDFQLSAAQNARLDQYLKDRFQGDFSMAGIRFWPEMRDLDEAFLQKAAGFRQIVPVFTNVIFDTSQVHANVIFPHMFAWLDAVLEIIRAHPETLFVIRAHPDEMRLNKESHESVRQWVERNQVDRLPNVVFIDSEEYLSSYRLIQRSKFVLVYNSSIGLEAALMGAAVLCGGKARYTQYPVAYFPQSAGAFRQQAEAFLAMERIEVPAEYLLNARRFLYFQLYRTALPFGDFLAEHHLPGFVRLRSFTGDQLSPEESPAMRILYEGITRGQPFLTSDETG
jgi:Capsule polysaccharide biosynthesis protein